MYTSCFGNPVGTKPSHLVILCETNSKVIWIFNLLKASSYFLLITTINTPNITCEIKHVTGGRSGIEMVKLVKLSQIAHTGIYQHQINGQRTLYHCFESSLNLKELRHGLCIL